MTGVEGLVWLGREDSNLRMPVPKTGALGRLATPHPKSPETYGFFWQPASITVMILTDAPIDQPSY